MSRIVAVAPVLPEFSYTQAEITRELVALIAPEAKHRAVLERMHAASGIQRRHTALPLERYRDLGAFEETNDLFIEVATRLGEAAIRAALDRCALTPADVDFILFTSVTGISAPSIDGLLVSKLGLRPDVKRMPSFGLGCVAGASGIARVHDYLLGHPRDVAVLLSVELCSLTLQRGDESMANLVASGLFGDGAAAVVMVGDEHRSAAGPTVVDTRSSYYPDTQQVIGWNIRGTGFEIVLSSGVAAVIEQNFPADVSAFLAAHSLGARGIDTWIAHPGGPRVLEAFAQALGLSPACFQLSWNSLGAVGNLSSASVLHILADALARGVPPGASGLLFALGPGVSAEFVLLGWP
ncbi:3-oxoacyl-[acyl-carrier-protein] synthase III C-terminal domain-containing protein [Parafrigoribacterium mesophilum]|uniref:type III polyketide synthase n=1 Tax=Parafrigoribacterium mesophilum TaxID=433646 RepID=UPI0031FD1ED4